MSRLTLALALLAGAAFAADPVLTPKPAAKMSLSGGLATPESVLYDAATDTYLVSNINGTPTDKDNNGYITELAPDGAVKAAKLVAGGAGGATLNAPKGMGVHNGVLYVADIDVVRLFDRKTGASKGEVAVPGASFLNDVAVGPDGNIYVSDTGVNAKFEPAGTDAIYRIKPGATPALETVVKSPDLHGPNGLLVTGDAVYVVPFGGNELTVYDLKGQKKSTTALPNGGLDGIVGFNQDDVLVSSWGGKAIYRGKPGGTFTAVVSDLEAPADITYDSKRGRLLVPRFMGNAVDIWEIK